MYSVTLVIFLEHVSERKIIQDMLIDYKLMTDYSAIITGVAKTLISRLQNQTSQCLRWGGYIHFYAAYGYAKES